MSINGRELDAMEFPEEPRATVQDGQIMCDSCGRPADTILLNPFAFECREIRAACPNCDPPGYPVNIESLSEEGFDWLLHISDKQPAGGATVLALLQWLDYDGVAVVDKGKRI